MLEMTRLIAVQRAFENIAAAMRSTEQTFGNAIETLGSKA
jgi:flagellar basal-body rod protein FlgF